MSLLLERTLMRRAALIVTLITLVGAALTVWAALAAQRDSERNVLRQFEGHAERLEHEIVARIQRAEYGLRGLRAAMVLRPAMTREEFRQVIAARNMLSEFRGIRGFGVVEPLGRSQINGFVERQRRSGFPNFNIKGYRGAPDLYVIKFVEPLAANSQALGLDLGGDPVRREAVERAIATGAPVLSGRIQLLQDAQQGPGWVLMMPVHERLVPAAGAMPTAGGEGRLPPSSQGRLLGLFQAPIVAREALGDLQAFVDFAIDFRLYDGQPREGRPMVDSQAQINVSVLAPADGAFAARRLVQERKFSVAGRLMTLQVASTPMLEAGAASLDRPAVLIGVGGMLLTSLLALAASLLLRGQTRAVMLANRMTADLERTTADLCTSNDRLQAVLDNLPCGLTVFDRDLRLVAQNAFLRQLLGLNESQAVPALAFSTLASMQGLPDWDGPDGEVMRASWKPITEAHRFERTLPSGIHLQIHAGPMPDGGFVMTYIDDSAQRDAEAALQASEDLMRLVTDNIPGRIAFWDQGGRCRFANREFLAGLGKTTGQVVGRQWESVYDCAHDPLRAARAARALAGERQVFEKREAVAGDGFATRLVHYIPQVEDGQVRGFFALGFDVTELRQARDDALRASQAKSRFVANMSHELRTPMNAVLGMLQLVQHTTLTTQQHDYVTKAEGAARALLSVLDDILDFSKVEAGKMTLDPREFEVDALLRDLSVIFATGVGTKPVDFLFDLHPDLPPRLVADDMRLRQVLINLGGNAIKFTAQGQVVLAVTPVDRTPGAVTVDFSITDTGIGIAPGQLASLFQDFGQAEATTTRRFGGTGLGLAISRRLVALMGGELRVESQEGRGSRFFFRLSMPLGDAPVAAGERAVCRVMIADCREVTRNAHLAMARSLGWTVSHATTAEEALYLAGAAPDLDAVFVDWQMGREVALEVARQLGDQLTGRATAIIVMGTSEVCDLLAQLEPHRQRHIGACLTRPVTPRMLAKALAEAQRSRRTLSAPEPSLAPSVEPPLTGLRLLVVDDNENNQLVARELLTRQGARVEIAVDGIDGVEKVRVGGPYDLVLMDWQMPRMDGLEATRAIRAIPGFETLPIVAITANAMASDRRECLAAGMNAHVAKPFVLRELVAVVLAHVRSSCVVMTPVADVPVAASGSASEVLLDRAGALANLGGMEELYDELLPLFRREAPLTLTRLVKACETGARQDARRLAHTLKGTAGTVGAKYLGRVCADAERVLAGEPSATDAVAIEALRAAIEQTLQVLPS